MAQRARRRHPRQRRGVSAPPAGRPARGRRARRGAGGCGELMDSVGPDDIEAAHRTIRSHIRETPVMAISGADIGSPIDLTLKLELLQHAGSFKPRGAFNRVLTAGTLPDSGLIAASGGNHGAAVAYVARSLGVAAEIFV